ncbi:hypothetical protein ACMAZE_12675 [Pseudopelagicola sp. nBUS_20]|uniref:hypothetical protein n=1 Tax=Pseudopelagicola sp. nBUS_20 TaxID=3395317 RepID=UPI003EB7A26D
MRLLIQVFVVLLSAAIVRVLIRGSNSYRMDGGEMALAILVCLIGIAFLVALDYFLYQQNGKEILRVFMADPGARGRWLTSALAKTLTRAETRSTEEKIYEQVAIEIASGEFRHGLYAQAKSRASGNTKKTEAIYIKLRAQAFRDEKVLQERKEAAMTRAASVDAAKQKEEAEKAASERAAAERETAQKAAAARATSEREAEQKAARERVASEKAAKLKAVVDKAEAKKMAKQRLVEKKAAVREAANLKAAADKLEKQRVKAEKSAKRKTKKRQGDAKERNLIAAVILLATLTVMIGAVQRLF